MIRLITKLNETVASAAVPMTCFSNRGVAEPVARSIIYAEGTTTLAQSTQDQNHTLCGYNTQWTAMYTVANSFDRSTEVDENTTTPELIELQTFIKHRNRSATMVKDISFMSQELFTAVFLVFPTSDAISEFTDLLQKFTKEHTWNLLKTITMRAILQGDSFQSFVLQLSDILPRPVQPKDKTREKLLLSLLEGERTKNALISIQKIPRDMAAQEAQELIQDALSASPE